MKERSMGFLDGNTKIQFDLAYYLILSVNVHKLRFNGRAANTKLTDNYEDGEDATVKTKWKNK